MSFAGRVRTRLDLGARRLRAAALPIVQCALAAGLAWWVAHDLVGHPQPFFAPVAAVLSLGASLGQRVRRAAELVVGVSVGVAVGDALVSAIGTGVWQIGLVVALAMAVAVFTDSGTLIVAQAASNAVLVATLLPPGQSGGIDRWVDALIGGAVGILIVVVLPSHPLGPVVRQSRKALDELSAVLFGVAGALRDRDEQAAVAALERARASQPLVDELRAAVQSGREVISLAPLRRPHRAELARFAELAARTDYAFRNTRVLARRALTALQDEEPTGERLADAVDHLGRAVRTLTAQVGSGDRADARPQILDLVRDAPVLGEPTALAMSEQVMVAQLRSLAIDLLQATGLTRAEARDALHAEL
ncbi:aromatic acid exporter family protein [Pseudonocardia ailaonensis]|uniref:Aromatic acid exporter family protein n=1 Tax=Pseudonocardia ailaonensis TaxID=367279 RepID=A0ABN2NTE1_9PSEU